MTYEIDIVRPALFRDAARMLRRSAMRRLGEDDASGAWSDAKAIRRLATAARADHPAIITYLVESAMLSVFEATAASILSHVDPKDPVLDRMEKDLRRSITHDHGSDLADAMRGERFYLLASCLYAAR